LRQKNPEKMAETIKVLTEEKRLFPPPQEFKESAHIKGMEEYTALYKESVEDPEGFWDRMAGIVDWTKKWDKVFECDFEKPEIKWFPSP
jgi:acetyl-CoA synthetase